MKPTKETFDLLQLAYDYFNYLLFEDQLPACMILLHRHKRAKGYYWPKQFVVKGDDTKRLDEIALNPNCFDRPQREILSTLVHEMVHLWQQHFGDVPRKAYHDRQWAGKMEAVGLMPTHTGEVNGKKTGQRMTHYIIEGGRFDLAEQSFTAQKAEIGYAAGVSILIQGNDLSKEIRPQTPSKVKFVCPDCSQKAWAKPTAHLVCGDCGIEMV
jgi:predicted SprT family Zn-dependent metalloprotease